VDKILASSIGGVPATWDWPIEVEVYPTVIRATASANRPAKLTIYNTFGCIYKENGIE
ncbi:hypothetical protein EDB86DRAFT_2771153, partial [Lactarius hatsudake]